MQALSIFCWVLFAFPGNCIPGSEKAVTFQFLKWRFFLCVPGEITLEEANWQLWSGIV